jgi:hypothetical protein
MEYWGERQGMTWVGRGMGGAFSRALLAHVLC